jgi:hypothetical protein
MEEEKRYERNTIKSILEQMVYGDRSRKTSTITFPTSNTTLIIK